jgi:hypothetical protein
LRANPIAAGHPLAGNPLYDVPRSRWLPNQVPTAAVVVGPPNTWPPVELLFDAAGQLTGSPYLNQKLVHIWMGERADKQGLRSRRLITLNTTTGAVAIYDTPEAFNPFDLSGPPAPPNYLVRTYGPAERLLGDSSRLNLPP